MKLVIAEKPSVARSIAGVIGATVKKNGYIEGDGYIVTWCFGHLVGLALPEEYDERYRKWDLATLPIVPDNWKYNVLQSSKDQFNVIKNLMNDSRVTETVCATDAGREGENIFRLVYNKIGSKKPIKRLWISSLEDSAIKEGFENLQPGENYDDLFKAANCRAKADWLVGLNSTRLFTKAYNSPKPLNVGRVETPTLAMVVEREKAISDFVKVPFYTVHLKDKYGLDASSDRFLDKEEAEALKNKCAGSGKAAVTNVTKEEKSVSQPKLYDMTTLQRDANRLFGFTAKQTLDCTQNLYEKKLCTYPRTDAQYLTDDMEQTALDVIDKVRVHILHDEKSFTPDVKRILNSKKVTDHHAIIPTVEIAKEDLSTLPETDMKILFLIANRLICATAEKHSYESVKAIINCEGTDFTATGKTVLNEGFKAYEDRFKRNFKADKEESEDKDEKALPKLSEGMELTDISFEVVEGFTQPPKHFTEDTLLSAMERAGASEMDDEVERKGLGTTATRAGIIEKLIHDGFIKREKKQMIPTEDGIKLISILPDRVKSAQLTAEWENNLVLVSKGEMKAEDFMQGIISMVSDLVKDYGTVKDEHKDMFAKPKESFGKCPNCGADILSGKFGLYCEKKCGMNLSFVRGQKLSDSQIKSLISGKKILVKGLKAKNGNTYDAYFVPAGTEPYEYTKDGKTYKGVQFKTDLEFPDKKEK